MNTWLRRTDSPILRTLYDRAADVLGVSVIINNRMLGYYRVFYEQLLLLLLMLLLLSFLLWSLLLLLLALLVNVASWILH